jgi:TM2 domain-containing membrane protein YozV
MSENRHPPDAWEAARRSFFFPGAGQFHNGQILKGLLLLPICGGFYILGPFVLMTQADVDRRNPIDPGFVSLYFEILGVFWILGVIDAYLTAARLHPSILETSPAVLPLDVGERRRLELFATLSLAAATAGPTLLIPSFVLIFASFGARLPLITQLCLNARPLFLTVFAASIIVALLLAAEGGGWDRGLATAGRRHLDELAERVLRRPLSPRAIRFGLRALIISAWILFGLATAALLRLMMFGPGLGNL